jgi:hypothetical protein
MGAILGTILGARRLRPSLTPQILKIIGYARDAVVIVGIIGWAMYVFANPDKVDVFLNWMIGAGVAT